MLHIFAVIIIIATIICPSYAAINAQQQSKILESETLEIGAIAGKVYALPLDLSGPKPLANATVYLIGGSIGNGFAFVYKQTTSDSNGVYGFNNLPLGRYIVLALKPGAYLPGFRTVKLTNLRPIRSNVNLFLIQLSGSMNAEYISEAMTMIPEDQQVLLQECLIENVQTQDGSLTMITFP